MSRRGLLAAVVLAGALLGGASGAGAGPTGRVEVRVTDHRAAIDDFATLHVELAEVALHGRGRPRDQGWVPAVRGAAAVDLVPLKEGRWAVVGVGTVPAERYDAVRVRFGAMRGALRAGPVPDVRAIGSTVAVTLTVVPDRVAAVLVDLYVEDVTDHDPGRYQGKVKAITAP